MTPRSTLIGPLAELLRSEVAADLQQKLGESTDWSEFCHLWGVDKLIFWSHYVLKQLIGRLLLCGICHVMVICLRNTYCWKVSTTFWNLIWALVLETQSHGASDSRSMGSLMGLGKWINSWGKLYSQNALHVESAKLIFTTIPILVVEHALSLRHVFNVFALFFPVCLFTILFIYGQTPGPNWFSTFCSEWSSFNAEIIHIYLKKKSSQVTKNPCLH